MRQCTLHSTKQMAPFFLSCAAYGPFSRFLPNWQSHDSEQFRMNGVICLNSSCTRMWAVSDNQLNRKLLRGFMRRRWKRSVQDKKNRPKRKRRCSNGLWYFGFLFHRKHGQCDLQPLSLLLYCRSVLLRCTITSLQPDITSLTSIYPDHIFAQNH